MAHKEGDLGRKRPLMLNQSIAQLQARRLASGYVECLVDQFFLMRECARSYTEKLIWKTSGRERREYIKNWKQWIADREKTRHGYCNMTVRHVISGNSFATRICVGKKDEAPTSWADIYIRWSERNRTFLDQNQCGCGWTIKFLIRKTILKRLQILVPVKKNDDIS